ncbi:MAG: Glu/Leu/Phe/Val dehydrogenase dimerization domain-containing protein [Planctomycetota bacterium]|jgi:leucine dehydrogenase
MTFRLFEAMASEGFEELHALHDAASGMRALVAIHDTSVGPAFGGVRRLEYASEQTAMLDCLRLARAMSWKCVLADLPAGGAKTVMLDRGDLDLEAAYRHVGRFVESLGGRHYSGPDVNTGESELAWLSSETRFATDPGPEGPGELADATAAGVFAGIGAALEHLDGEVDWPARRIVVQGLGAVGGRLARRLKEVGAEVVASEIDDEHGRAMAAELELELVEPGVALAAPCDVLSPNALGGTLHDLSIPRLAARAVCGGANNVLASSAHGERLHESGVLFVPDFVVSCGALVRGVIFHLEGRREPVDRIEARIGKSARELLGLARERDLPPSVVAVDEARARIDRRRNVRRPPRERDPLEVVPPSE